VKSADFHVAVVTQPVCAFPSQLLWLSSNIVPVVPAMLIPERMLTSDRLVKLADFHCAEVTHPI
jgi:hypothetical protein